MNAVVFLDLAGLSGIRSHALTAEPPTEILALSFRCQLDFSQRVEAIQGIDELVIASSLSSHSKRPDPF